MEIPELQLDRHLYILFGEVFSSPRPSPVLKTGSWCVVLASLEPCSCLPSAGVTLVWAAGQGPLPILNQVLLFVLKAICRLCHLLTLRTSCFFLSSIYLSCSRLSSVLLGPFPHDQSSSHLSFSCNFSHERMITT